MPRHARKNTQEIIDKFLELKSGAETARFFNKDPSMICKILRQNGFKLKKIFDEDLILETYDKLKSVSETAKCLNIAYSAAWKRIAGNGIKLTSTKLDDNQVKIVVEDYLNGKSVKQLAIDFGVSAGTIENNLNNSGVHLNHSCRKFPINHDFFKDIYAENFLWFLGWMYSDGNVSKKGVKNSVSVHSNDADGLFAKFDKLIYFGNRGPRYYSKNKKLVEFIINSKEIKRRMIELGCIPNKSLIIEYPTFFTEDEHHWAFLRGVLEGDGHISVTGTRWRFACEIASGSKNFLLSIQKILKEKLDIDTAVRYAQTPSGQERGARIVILGGHKQVLKFVSKIYKNGLAEYYLDRKFEVYNKMKYNMANPRIKQTVKKSWKDGYLKDKDNNIYYTNCRGKFAKKYNLNKTSIIYLCGQCAEGHVLKRCQWSKPLKVEIDNAVQGGSLIKEIF